MNEADTRANLIDPKLRNCGWEKENIMREFFFTAGRKLIGNKRGERLRADYILLYQNTRIAFIEAKEEKLSPTEGLEQVKNYGIKLGLPIVYSTNGHQIYEFDLRTGKGDFIENYPSPMDLYERVYPNESNLTDKLLTIPLLKAENKQERYYQEIAIRNILSDQAINAFNYFEKDIIKITGHEIRKRGGVAPTERNFYFAIYQAIADRKDKQSTDEDDSIDGHYKLYPPDFFDVVMIDECHRGSANEKGSWRKILDYFGSALHIGLTATPKHRDNADTYAYFGEPVYQYSLIDGINDGFLTPYKVLRLTTNLDTYRIAAQDRILQGNADKEEYQLSDFERNIKLSQRTYFIAQQILKHINI